MINNRQAGRRRGRGGQQQRSQSGNTGRGQDTGNRIDNRSRGNAAQLLEKYKALARDSQMQGDRVNTEYYLQFADHYFRVLAETRSRQEENRTPAPGGANSFQDDENDYDDDGEPIVRAEQQRGNEGVRDGNRDANRDGGNRENGGNRDAGRNEGRNEGRSNGYQNGQNGTQNGQYENDRPRTRQNGNGGGGNGGEDRYARDDRSNGDDRGPAPDRNDRNDRQSYAPDNYGQDEGERAAAPTTVRPAAVRQDSEPQEDRPKRGRPRRAAPVEESAGFEADRLPPSLSISAVSEDAEEKPRRRRVRAVPSETPPTA